MQAEKLHKDGRFSAQKRSQREMDFSRNLQILVSGIANFSRVFDKTHVDPTCPFILLFAACFPFTALTYEKTNNSELIRGFGGWSLV